MRIAFDAKRAFLNDTGLGNYSRVLLDSLFRNFPGNDYFLATTKLSQLYQPPAGDNIHVITPAGIGKIFKSLWRSSLVKNELNTLSVDVYHGLSHEIPVGINKTNVRSVVTMHDLIFERYPEQYKPADVRIYRAKFKYACEHADKVIAISKQTMQDLVELYHVPQEKIEVCYQSCQGMFMQQVTKAEKERVRKEYNLPSEYFLYVGSVIERKNLLLICKALDALKDKAGMPLVVIGKGGAYMKEVQEYIISHGLSEQVYFLSVQGHVTSSDFPAIYQSSQALVYPSIFEGFGIPVLEAMYSGTPVITSYISSMPEVGGDAAFYIDPFNVDSLINAMQQVATDGELRQAMITKGIEQAQRFSQDKAAADVMSVYEAVVKQAR